MAWHNYKDDSASRGPPVAGLATTLSGRSLAWTKAIRQDHPCPLLGTNLVHRMFQGLGEMPFFLLQQAGPQEVLYGYVGTDDYTLDPLIRPGAFVQIDPQQNKVTKGVWPSDYERPVYFVELRDNRYACSWCELEGNYLLLVPSPKSPVPIRHLRYPQDAEIVGRVVGFAHRIAQLQPRSVRIPLPGTGLL